MVIFCTDIFHSFFVNAFPERRTLACCDRLVRICGALPETSSEREHFGALGTEVHRPRVRIEWGDAPSVIVAMLIESTEQFQASDGIAIRRGPNEVTESDYERLPVATRTKLRILQEHGVVRLHPRADTVEKRASQDK